MKRNSPIRHVLFLLLTVVATRGQAQPTDPDPSEPVVETSESSETPEASETSETSELESEETEVAERAPHIRFIGPDIEGEITQPDDEVEEVAEPVVVQDVEDDQDSLVPTGEDELMSPHAVDLERFRFVPGKGLEINSADGLFRIRTRVRVQLRWAGEEDGSWGQQFGIRRARLVFDGHAFHPDTQYKFEIALSPNDVGLRDNLSADGLDSRPSRSPLLDFYVDFRQLRDFQVRIGQYKVPSNRQRVISSGNLQLVDRSPMNSEFTLDRDVGFDVRSRDFLGLDMLRYYLGVYIARGRDSRGFDDFGMMYLARVEFLPLGIFNDYSEVDFARTGPRLSIGVGGAYIDRARRDRGIRGSAPADGGTTDTQHVFADFLFKWAGLSVMTEFAWRNGSRNPGDAVDDMGVAIPVAATRDGLGLNVQAGYLIPRLPVEIAGRYSLVRGASSGALGDTNELVAGLSYYLGRHPYKIQFDYARLWNEEIKTGEQRIRLQIQVSL